MEQSRLLLARGFRLAAWALVLFLAWSTLGPVSLRPYAPMLPSAHVERLFAYFTLGAAFSFAYPKHKWAGFLAAFACALPMELVQELIPGRDGRWQDLVVKLVGGTMGATFATITLMLPSLALRLVTAVFPRRYRDDAARHDVVSGVDGRS
jgi:VanZ family protein